MPSYSLPALIHNIMTKIVRINTTLMMPPRSSTQPNTSKYVSHNTDDVKYKELTLIPKEFIPSTSSRKRKNTTFKRGNEILQ
jgi:hypothetical protein